MINYILLAQKPGGGGPQIFLFLIIGVLFYMMLIRPQQKQRKQQQQMLSSLRTGDRVMTMGGVFGLITNVKEHSVILKIADNVKIEVSRGHISRVIRKEDDKPAESTADIR